MPPKSTRDNALARELIARGHDVTLVPVYTPTTPDEPNISRDRVLFGGISVYLQQHSAFFRRTPRFLDRLLDSPFLIAQDLLSLDGFAIQRAGAGINLSSGRNRVGLAIAVENLTDKYYREQFQFAPSRGRSFTIGLNIGAF